MSELPAGHASSRRAPTAYLTVEEFQERYDPRALAWYCRNDLPTIPLPDPPVVIQNLVAPERRQRTLEIWQATVRLLQALDAWQEWFRKLRAEGDADPAVALWCEATAVQSIRVLCSQRANAPPFDIESEADIRALLPPTPTWALARTEYRCDHEREPSMATPMPRWQQDPEFLGSYYLGGNNRLKSSTRLRGAALQFLLLLESFPMTALPHDLLTANAQAVRQSLHREIERINVLHRLAGRCLNTVLRLHTLRHYDDGDRHGRDALLALQQAANELPELPLADDPFAADDVVEEAGVVATSMHTASLEIARQTWQSVQMPSLVPEMSSDHTDATDQPYTRITSALMRQAPTEVSWSADVWQRVRQQLADVPALDVVRIQTRLALERNRAVRQLETRFGILVTAGEMIPSSVVPQVAEQELAATATSSQLSADDDLPFIPSELQQCILEVLQHKALTLDALAVKLDIDRSNLHRDGIKELKRRGLIDNNRRVGGYYRPDVPPPKYAEQLGKKPG